MASDEEIIESELKGKTLLVYTHMLKQPNDPVGVREVQRELGFSSPSVSSYHLNKLQELGLVENEYGDYKLVKDIKVGVLKQFITLGGVILPRYLFYAVLMTTMLMTYLIQTPYFPSSQYFTTLMMGLVPSVILWYETIKIWKDRPQ
ncbi:MAG TPA: ArsR family transcriptional regulator [Candidatus Bathyarchaeota archaeon]|nr:ArsR family transcriptional regulator [Candidatus Bathyarchaeota archaeon]